MSTQGTEGVYRDHDCGADGHTTDGGRVSGVTRWTYAECAHYGCPVRVFIDPEDTEALARLIRALVEASSDPGIRAYLKDMPYHETAAALRSLIAPPKPAEPQGLGAVVEDAEGWRWIRVDWTNPWCIARPNAREPYQQSSELGSATHDSHVRWDKVAAVRVLSEGWTE